VADELFQRALDRRLLFKYAAATFGAAAAVRVLGPEYAAAQDDAWSGEPDMAKAAEQAKEFTSYGMPDDWANYGEVLQKFGTKLNAQITHKEINSDASSLEEIELFEKEKGNPVAMTADIGLLWGTVAEQRGVSAPYSPPSAEKLPEGYKAKSGGWVATFAGVPAFVVNLDAVKNQNLPEPATWDDLLKPELKGKIASPGDPRASGTAQTTFLAWGFAHGGDATNLQPAVDFAKKLIPNYHSAGGGVDLMEKGEQVVWMRYDFNCAAVVQQLKEKNINAKVVIPGVSIYAPSALLGNRYFSERADAIKAFLEYVLSDEAQITFAKFGARPIRSVFGQIELPADAKANWLPDEQYKDVVVVDNFAAIDPLKIADTWDKDVLGN
jgi:putative spermidine/putrescine transport system substrate-binding protein